jgi:hypothetical protein
MRGGAPAALAVVPEHVDAGAGERVDDKVLTGGLACLGEGGQVALDDVELVPRPRIRLANLQPVVVWCPVVHASSLRAGCRTS